MFIKILIGSAIIFVTIVIQILFFGSAIEMLKKRIGWLNRPPFFIKTTISMTAVVLWLVVGISLSAWAWSGLFLIVGAFEDLESALYFSIVTFTTLGYGDITLDPPWRILASFAAVNGLIIFGLNTAFLVEFTNKLHASHEQIERAKE